MPQGRYDLQSTEIEERRDARNRAYYWIGLRRRRAPPPEGTDLGTVYGGKISVTPLHMNLTETAVLEKLRPKAGPEINGGLTRNPAAHSARVKVFFILNGDDPFRDIMQKA